MKQSPEILAIEKRLKPGRFSRDGFLGEDPRQLAEILLEDDLEVKRLDLSHELIASRMRYFRDQAEAGLEGEVRLEPNFVVRSESARGKIPCPFGHRGGSYPKNITTVLNTRLNKQIVFSDLSIHLIGEHGFYQGRGAYFRNDPRTISEVLEIEAQAGPRLD